MEQVISSDFKLGIISGGQLGKMMIDPANKWDVQTYVLDASADCPSAKICHDFTLGDVKDYDAVFQFGQKVDMIALEVENVNVEALVALKAQGKKVFPDPDILKIIQDKGLQKEFYANHQIPTANFELYKNQEDIITAVNTGEITLPFVQKTRTEGYDGKGVKIVKSEEDLNNLLDGASVIEDLTDIKKELSVIVAQNTNGEIGAFPTVEMVVN